MGDPSTGKKSRRRRTTRREMFGAAAGSAVVLGGVAAVSADPGPSGRREDPGYFGTVESTVDDRSLRLRLHDTGEVLLIQALAGAEIGRDGAAQVSDFQPGERVTALGSLSDDGSTVSAQSIFSVADLFEDVAVSGRRGDVLATSAGAMSLGGRTEATDVLGPREDLRATPKDRVAPGARLMVVGRKSADDAPVAVWAYAERPE